MLAFFARSSSPRGAGNPFSNHHPSRSLAAPYLPMACNSTPYLPVENYGNNTGNRT